MLSLFPDRRGQVGRDDLPEQDLDLLPRRRFRRDGPAVAANGEGHLLTSGHDQLFGVVLVDGLDQSVDEGHGFRVPFRG